MTDMDRPLRVALVTFDFGEVCVRIANALSQDADVTLVLPRRELELAEVPADGAVRVVAYTKPRLRQPLRQLRMCATVLEAIRAAAPDVVHVQQGHLWFNLALPLLGDRPLVLTVHDAEAHVGDRGARRTPQIVMNLAFRRADRFIVHARYVAERLLRHVRRDPATIDVIPHVAIGIDAAAAAGPDDDGRTVLFFGRIWPYKGLEHLIAAEAAITRAFPTARFVIAGGGEPLDRYRAMMRDPSRFTVHEGFVPTALRDALFREAAVVVLPYVEASQSGVVPVAYAFEKPVVVSAVGGLPEAVEHGRTGLVVPPGDPGALAEAVVRLLRDRAQRRAMGEAGRRVLETEWSPAAVAARTRETYARVATPGAGGAADAAAVRHAAVSLHRHLDARHAGPDGLRGPDPGIRLNYRFGRFVKAHLRALPWRDELYYLQAQGHWQLANWRLHDLTGEHRPVQLALDSARGIRARQRADGAWDYPNREWHGRLANAEGSWAAIGLAETYRRTGDPTVLETALRWHRHHEERVGYADAFGGLSANYFSGRPQTALVPNTSAFVLRMHAELADATGDDRLLANARGLMRFLAAAQRPSGEVPYTIARGDEVAGATHFQCPQYNAFICLDLLRYGELTDDPEAARVVGGLVRFLAPMVRADGAVPYACHSDHPRVTYHGAVVAAALLEAARAGHDGGAQTAGRRALRRVLSVQRADGGFGHSRRDYALLSDPRSYPRGQAMILHHLLLAHAAADA